MTRRSLAFAACNGRRLLKDPVTLFFGLAFPVVLLILMRSVEQASPVAIPVFEIGSLAPGMCLFGLSFLPLFTGQIVSRDREGAFLARLTASPMTAGDFILGYLLPMLPFAALQVAACLLVAGLLGLPWSGGMLLVVVALLPSALLFIGIGLLCGTLMTERQVGGICGGLLATLVAWLGGVFVPLQQIGGALLDTARAFPFLHGADAAKAALEGDWPAMWSGMGVGTLWAAALLILSVLLFRWRLVQR